MLGKYGKKFFANVEWFQQSSASINTKLTRVMTDTVQALDGSTSSEIFAKHFNLLHASRKAFIEIESSERVRRALRSKVRASEQIFSNGKRVYYKREGRERWLGPGKVIFGRHWYLYVFLKIDLSKQILVLMKRRRK